ncbi:5-hydroxyisourate hydrolase [Novosphingobium sp. PhB57]|jgi:5-hydroxyisourate hydrolase|uniref:hydroxyisourate hydrolase n=1 Tax=Novosphingobium sp. PhB57 TaxID=2485107 RepID=UPI001053DF9B|nr:hydroxyisourate hydrolase [Novosphingobium sp. PhB57]TCU52272.1 5-hydroxyisourate hydrolase [Novosphingobium sp. PhB57]
MTGLSTHVLDTTFGCPAEGIALELAAADGGVLFTGVTDADGRCPGIPRLGPGSYLLTFSVADYFRAKGIVLSQPPFLDRVPIAFGVAGAGHYHVPLLISPHGYSTYRGS